MENKNLIISIIYSFKDLPFNMADVMFLTSKAAESHNIQIGLEEICATVDALAKEGTIEYITMPNGKGAIKLSDATLTKVVNEALNGQTR